MNKSVIVFIPIFLLSVIVLLSFNEPSPSPDLEAIIHSTNHSNNPEELGDVNWLRDYDEAITQSKKVDKPILILFQEIPGCGTCKRFGNQVLSHPLIVDAIENEFVPLAIYNNKKGKDLDVLKSFNEPTWNNPVVRIIDTERKELTKRISRYNSQELVSGMVASLKKAEKNIPPYLDFLQTTLTTERVENATYSMYCFWSGESKLGNIEGVISTEPGFMNGTEVVNVAFDPEIIDYESLSKKAVSLSAASAIYTNGNNQEMVAKKIIPKNKVKPVSKFRSDNEPKYYLSKTAYRFVPMLPVQLAKVNAAVGNRKDIQNLLSPRQIKLYEFIKAHPDKEWYNAIASNNFVSSWEKAMTNME